MNNTTYDPQIQSLLADCATDWGNPIKNRSSLIPYGVHLLDLALYGIDPEGELVIVQGEQKNRKSTFVANIVANIMSRASDVPTVNIDTLESGMRPKKYRDVLISIVATRYLMNQGHRCHQSCPVCGTERCKQLGISPKFLKYNSRTAQQQEAIDAAIMLMMDWPLLLHGAHVEQGNTRNLKSTSAGTKNEKSRWLRLVEEHGVKVIVSDHIQQYAFNDEPTDYEKQIRAIGAIGDFSSQYNIAFLALSQVSLTSLRAAKENGEKLTAAGGAKAAQEANTVFTVSYKPDSGNMKIKIEESRDAGSFSIWQALDDVSGSFYGEAKSTPPMA